VACWIFGTTVLSASDGTIAGLLGASPGASTAVPAMIDVMEPLFFRPLPAWLPRSRNDCRRLAPSFRASPALFEEVWSWGTKMLKLDKPPAGGAARAAARGVRRRHSQPR